MLTGFPPSLSTMKTIFAALMVWSVFLMAPLLASIGETPILQPETHESPSGKWKLEVDPNNREGSGKATYRMTRDRGEVWTKEFPFTLWQAELSDAGETVGYGYSHGMQGPGTLDVVILDPDGGIRMKESIKRKEGNFLHATCDPMGAGTLVHTEADRFVMMTTSMSSAGWNQKWLVYQLSNGRKLTSFDPLKAAKLGDSARYAINTVPLKGAPLLLEHWYTYQEGKRGGVFVLADFSGHRIWSLDLPKDYTIPDDDDAEDKLVEEIELDGAILDAKTDGEFEIRCVKAGERVRYKVEPDGDSGWKVREISRSKYQAPSAEKPEAEPQTKPRLEVPLIKPIGNYRLGEAVSSGPIRDISGFDIDDHGRFGFLRSARGDAKQSFVLIDQDSKLLAEIPLPSNGKTTDHCAWLAGSRWILTASESGVDGKTKAWTFDAETKTLMAIDGFESYSVNVIRGTGDGGFVVLSTCRQQYSSSDYLTAYDTNGKLRWRFGAREMDGERSLFSPQDIAVTPTREIAVLENIRNTVRIFSDDGKPMRSVDLAKRWKYNPNYPTEIAALPDGGFVVLDFHGKAPLVKMTPDGAVAASFTPKHADGREIDISDGLRMAPDGGLWVCDRQAFYQISDQGGAMKTLGAPPDEDKLEEVAALTGDASGNIFAADRRSAAVHVFGPGGGKLHVCKPDKKDFREDLGLTQLTVANDGGVFLEMEDSGGKQRYLHFGPKGERIGVKTLGVDDITEDWFIRPGTSDTLVIGYHAAALVNADGKIIRRIERQADRRWFDDLAGAAFADDGSFAILNKARRGGNSVTFFYRDGVAESTCKIDLKGYLEIGGYNGRQFTISGDGCIAVFDRTGKPIARAMGTEKLTDHFLTRSGRELRVVNRDSREVSCFEIP